MYLNNWKKVENEAGYPCYVDELTGTQTYDHPGFQKIIESLEEYSGMKYSTYRTAFKIFALQKQLRVPPLRISSGVFARHQLSLSESSLSLDTTELEAVLADIYFAAEKECLFSGDVDLAVDLLINLLLNVYDKDRKEPVRVLAAKTILILLSEESVSDKWLALANCCADHNGCVSPRRLAALLTHVMALPRYLGSQADQLQTDVDACFEKSAGMLGLGARSVAEWGAQQSSSTRWLPVVQRVLRSRSSASASSNCAACNQLLTQVLKFKCTKCNNVHFCEKCYLFDKDLSAVSGHKKTHLVQEIVDGETQPSECLSFMRSMGRFFFCTKTKKKKTTKKVSKRSLDKENGAAKKRKDGRPAIFTSTVGKASGHAATANTPACMLQDIIMQLEMQNKALKELSSQLENVAKDTDDGLKEKVDTHYSQISTQINRLKIVKENLAINTQNIPTEAGPEKSDRPQAFDLFSPIPIEEAKSKVTDDLKTQPRVLSLDSGNFSVISKQAESQNLLTVSGDALKPVVVNATTDSISTVSMNDISNWYNETESQAQDKRSRVSSSKPRADSSQSVLMTEQRFAAELRAVATGNDKLKMDNANLDTVLDRLQEILANNFAMDVSSFDNTQLRESANEVEGLLGTLIRGVEQRATMNGNRGSI